MESRGVEGEGKKNNRSSAQLKSAGRHYNTLLFVAQCLPHKVGRPVGPEMEQQ